MLSMVTVGLNLGSFRKTQFQLKVAKHIVAIDILQGQV
jgi:hypothetical protein